MKIQGQGRLGRRLRRALCATTAVVGAMWAGNALGQTLQEALALAYSNNPTLEAARVELRAVDEQVNQAQAGFRPFAEAEIAGSRVLTDTDLEDSDTERTPVELSVGVSQPLYRGGRTTAAVRRAESTVQAQRAALLTTEQSVLFQAAQAYMDVVRDQAVLELTINNEQVLRRQLEASQDRFAVGEVTRTDVAQSESRLAEAIALRIEAEGNLNATRATFERVIGVLPGELSTPTPVFDLPTSLEETIALVRANNPQVITAQFVEQAALSGVDEVRGELLPEATLSAKASRTYDPAGAADRADSFSVTARLTIPLYQSGQVYSRVREAKLTAGQRRIEIDEAQRDVTENAISAWEALETARASIESRRAQVEAAEIALEGVRQEALVGARTTLDVLDQEQELLDARVDLVQAKRDEIVAAFGLLTAIGQMTAGNLGLPVDVYNVEEYYNYAKGKWFGTSIDPVPRNPAVPE